MFRPSAWVRSKMAAAQGGIWAERCGLRRREVALLVKCKTPVAKAMLNGAETRLLICDAPSEYGSVRCVGLAVGDQVGHPQVMLRAFRTRDEQRLLLKSLTQRPLPLYVFDELDRCVGGCSLLLKADHSTKALERLRSAPSPYAGRFGPAIAGALDQFEAVLDAATRGDRKDLISADWSLEDWKVMSLYGLGSGIFRLDQQDGAGLEQMAHQLVESLFLGNAFRSPNIGEGKKLRELCDSLLLHAGVFCLMEAKALGVTGHAAPMSTAGAARRTRKDLTKGLRQLQGAVRTLRSGVDVFETHQAIPALARTPNQQIALPARDGPMLGLVVVSDLECELDWRQVAASCFEAGDDRTAYQVMDLTELRSLVSGSRDPGQFLLNLITRWGQAKKHGTMLLRARIRRR